MRGFFFSLLVFIGLLLLLLPQVAVAQIVTVGPDSVVVPTFVTAADSTADSASKAVSAPKAPLSGPAKAALWGLIPGGGQVYNRDYWKIPIVYAALGGITYSFVFANTRFREFQAGYIARTDNDATTTDTGPRSSQYAETASGAGNVLRVRDFYRRNRDLSVIGGVLIYGLTIAEALVDANLATFSVSDDLSLRLAPGLIPQPHTFPAPGLGLTLHLNHRK